MLINTTLYIQSHKMVSLSETVIKGTAKGIFEKKVAKSISVGRSEDQAMSAQFFFTPLLECDQTWYSGCPRGVDNPNWFFRTWSRSYCWFLKKKMLTFQYLLPPLLENCETWYSRCPLGNRWSLLIFRSHVEGCLNISWPLCIPW